MQVNSRYALCISYTYWQRPKQQFANNFSEEHSEPRDNMREDEYCVMHSCELKHLPPTDPNKNLLGSGDADQALAKVI